MKNFITEPELKEMGFETTREYEHDEFITYIATKGYLSVETTCDKVTGMTITQELAIWKDVTAMNFTAPELKFLDKIFNK